MEHPPEARVPDYVEEETVAQDNGEHAEREYVDGAVYEHPDKGGCLGDPVARVFEEAWGTWVGRHYLRNGRAASQVDRGDYERDGNEG